MTFSAGPHLGTLTLLALTLGAVTIAGRRVDEPLASPLETIPLQIAGLTALENPRLTEGVLGQLRPTEYLSRTYSGRGLSLDLFIAFYASQRAGESMHSPKHCLPGAGWEIWDHGGADIPVDGNTVRVNNYSITRNGQRMTVLYWYQSKRRLIASEYLGKLLLANDALLHGSTAGSIVRIVLPSDPAALPVGRAFAAELVPMVHRCFGD